MSFSGGGAGGGGGGGGVGRPTVEKFDGVHCWLTDGTKLRVWVKKERFFEKDRAYDRRIDDEYRRVRDLYEKATGTTREYDFENRRYKKQDPPLPKKKMDELKKRYDYVRGRHYCGAPIKKRTVVVENACAYGYAQSVHPDLNSHSWARVLDTVRVLVGKAVLDFQATSRLVPRPLVGLPPSAYVDVPPPCVPIFMDIDGAKPRKPEKPIPRSTVLNNIYCFRM
jgi:hypothetical protein